MYPESFHKDTFNYAYFLKYIFKNIFIFFDKYIFKTFHSQE